MPNRWVARGLLLIMGLSWGLSFSLARVAALGGVHPLSLTFYEAAGAGIILVLVALIRREPLVLGRAPIVLYLVTALVGMVIPAVIFFSAAKHVGAGVLSISLAIVPILTFLVSASLRLEAFAPLRLLGVGLGTLAIILLVAPQESLPDPAQMPWILISLIAAASYGSLNIIMARWKPADVSSFGAAVGMFVAASVMMVPVLAVTGTFVPFAWPWTEVEWAMVALGAINALGYAIYFYLIETAGPVFTSQTANLVTLFGVLWGMVLFGEQHSAWVWLSLATMMLAVALVLPRAKAAVAGA